MPIFLFVSVDICERWTFHCRRGVVHGCNGVEYSTLESQENFNEALMMQHLSFQISNHGNHATCVGGCLMLKKGGGAGSQEEGK